MQKLFKNFYFRDSVKLAVALLGKILVHESDERLTSEIIVETDYILTCDFKIFEHAL